MSNFVSKLMATFLSVALFTQTGSAQDFQNVGQYMEYIGKANEKVTAIYLSYLSAVGHNKSARKVEKRRQEVTTAIFDTRFEIMGMPPWKGDRTYRDTTVAYFKLLHSIFNEDYAKIVNMEEIAEQSYDAMEAYMLAQEKAGEKLVEANDRQQRIQKAFAEKYNVQIVNNVSELDSKSRQAGNLMKHYNEVYLIFFKAFKQEAYLMDAVTRKNIVAIEQSKNALQKYAEEGLKKLSALQGYNNDPGLITACRTTLSFYKSEAERAQFYTDFFLQEEAFAKLKKGFDTKPAAQRTQQEVDAFNKGVKDINTAINTFNNSNNQLNKERDMALNTWNNMVKTYLDHYMPVQRKA